MPQLVRAWGRQYLPQATGGVVRLRLASEFRAIEAGDGITDRFEGLRRHAAEGYVAVKASDDYKPGGIGEHLAIDVHMVHDDDQEITLRGVRSGDKRTYRYAVDVADNIGKVPYLLCFSLLPTNAAEWRRLISSLEAGEMAWTCSTDVASLKFELEWGIKRWLATQQVQRHLIRSAWGVVKYALGDRPKAQSAEEMIDLEDAIFGRWFRKVNSYRHQREYRFMFIVESEELPEMPPWIDVELTKSGISLFEPYEPPADALDVEVS